MRLALIADLHFGSVPDGLGDELAGALEGLRPDVIVVAGDLTLRARATEFTEAHRWLSSLEAPRLVLPGNHDLPYLNLYQRFTDPFGRFHRATGSSDLMPVFSGSDSFILGLNTAASIQPHLRWQEGVARQADIGAAHRLLEQAGEKTFKAVVTHHPLLKVPGVPYARPVRRASLALDAFTASGVNVVFSGHTHRSFALEAEHNGRAFLAIGAPTALSRRLRGEPNGFWVIDQNGRSLHAGLYVFKGGRFVLRSETIFRQRKL